MRSAFKRVESPLSERYLIECARDSCRHPRQLFGTEKDARAEALRIGWEFRVHPTLRPVTQLVPTVEYESTTEQAFCPHCKLLVKA